MTADPIYGPKMKTSKTKNLVYGFHDYIITKKGKIYDRLTHKALRFYTKDEIEYVKLKGKFYPVQFLSNVTFNHIETLAQEELQFFHDNPNHVFIDIPEVIQKERNEIVLKLKNMISRLVANPSNTHDYIIGKIYQVVKYYPERKKLDKGKLFATLMTYYNNKIYANEYNKLNQQN